MVNDNLPIRGKLQVAKVYEPLFKKNKRFKVCFGGRGAGRSQSIARGLIMMSCIGKFRIWCAREFDNSLKDSVQTLFETIITNAGMGGDFIINGKSIVNAETGSEFIFKGIHGSDNNILSAEKLKAFEDVDICWIEEAQQISEASLNILGPTIRKDGSQIWFSFNRTTESDPVWKRYCAAANEQVNLYEARYFEDNNRLIIYATYEDNPFFTEALEIERQECLKNAPEDYDWIWLGKPSSKGAYKALFSPKEINEACRRIIDDYQVESAPKVGGLDCAGTGKDTCTFAVRQGLKAYPIERQHITNPLAQANWFTVNLKQADPDGSACDKAYGSAVLAICNGQLNFNITGIDFAMSPNKPDVYANKRAEMYGNLLDWIRAGGALPDDAELREELLAIENDLAASARSGRIQLISKEKIRAKIGRSPDKADALALTFAITVMKRAAQQMLNRFGQGERAIDKVDLGFKFRGRR